MKPFIDLDWRCWGIGIAIRIDSDKRFTGKSFWLGIIIGPITLGVN